MVFKIEDICLEVQSKGLFGNYTRIRMMHMPTKLCVEREFHRKVDREEKKAEMLEKLKQMVCEYYERMSSIEVK